MNKNRLRKEKKHMGNMTLRERWRHGDAYRSYIGMLRSFGFIKDGKED